MTPEYYIRPVAYGWYEIAKFEGGDAPVQIYRAKGDFCNCPASAECKHLSLVRRFQVMGEPWLTTYWMENAKWQWHQLLKRKEILTNPRKRKLRK